jgi:hypothetical protein
MKHRIYNLVILVFPILYACSFSKATAQTPDTTSNFQYLPVVQKNDGNSYNNYYVDSVNGSDANSGTSPSAPWRTLAPVNSFHFPPGSTIEFKRGSTWTGGLVINDSGVEGKPITFKAYGSGERPIITNPGTSKNLTRAVNIEASWIIFEDFLLQNAYEAGVNITSSNVVVQNIEVTNTGVGIRINGGNHNLVTHNYVHDLHIVVNTPGGVDDYGAIGVLMLNTSFNEISYNRMVRCIAPSLDFGTDGGAVEWYGVSNNNYVHHNWATDSEGFFEVGGGEALNNKVSYNVSINNGIFGLFNLTGPFQTNVENFRIENNTIIEVNSTHWALIGFGIDAYPDVSTVLFYNNIVYIDSSHLNVTLVTGFAHDNNLYYLEGGAQLSLTPGPHDIIADPLFINFANEDYRLQNGSPARDTGRELEYRLDFDNNPVPVGKAPDRGAYEYQNAP